MKHLLEIVTLVTSKGISSGIVDLLLCTVDEYSIEITFLIILANDRYTKMIMFLFIKTVMLLCWMLN